MPEGEATLIAMVVPTPASPIPCQARPTYSSPLLSINYCCPPRFLPFPPAHQGKFFFFFLSSLRSNIARKDIHWKMSLTFALPFSFSSFLSHRLIFSPGLKRGIRRIKLCTTHGIVEITCVRGATFSSIAYSTEWRYYGRATNEMQIVN